MPDKPPVEIFKGERWGASTYTIPGLKAGYQYKVNLFFAEQHTSNVNARAFNVVINHKQVLTNYNVLKSVGSRNVAVEQSFLAPADSSGNIVISLIDTGTPDTPMINGVQVIPTDSTKPLQSTALNFATQISGMGTYTLSSTSNSNEPVSYTVISGPASIVDNKLTVWSGGTVVVEASQSWNNTNLDAAVRTTTLVDTATSAQLTWSDAGNANIAHPGSDAPNNYIIDKNGQFFTQNAFAQYNQKSSDHNWSFYTGPNEANVSPAPANSYNSSWSVNGVARPDTRMICTSGNPVWTTFTSKTGLTNGGGAYADGNFCDLIGVWVDPDTGDWYGIIHNELYPNAPRIDVLSYAVSTDRGNSWTMKGPIIANTYGIGNGKMYTYEYGAGDPRFYVDTQNGYFYIAYMTRAHNLVNGQEAGVRRVARAPIRQKFDPSSWQKFYQGKFQSVPGLEWTCDPYKVSNCPAGDAATAYSSNVYPDNNPVKDEVFKWPLSAQSATDTYFTNVYAPWGASWNVYLGKYVSVMADNTSTRLYVWTTSDLSTQKWTYAGQVPYAHKGPWYQWVRDTNTKTTSMTTGKTLDFVCTTSCDGGRTISVAFKSGVTPPASFTTYNGTAASSTGFSIQHPTSGSPAQSGANGTWTFTPVGDGFFYIAQNGSYLTAADGDAGRAWGARVSLAPPLASSSSTYQLSRQQWYFEPVRQVGGTAAPANRYRLVNRYSGLPLAFASATQTLTSANLGAAALVPNRDWDPASAPSYGTYRVADQTLIFVAK